MPPRIYLTGRLTVEHDGRLAVDEPDLPGRQGRLAFAFLATSVDRPPTRAEFIDAIWNADVPRELDTTLNAILSRIRSVLRKSELPLSLDVQHGSIALRVPAGTWIDVEAAANAIDEAEGAWRRGDARAAWGPANIGSVIARRPFLAGEEAAWIQGWRNRLKQLLVRGLHCLSGISAANGEAPVALQYAEEIVDLEPYRETAYQHLMRLHAAMGNSAEALRVFGRCREHLRDELGASPSPETERLYLSILRGEPVI